MFSLGRVALRGLMGAQPANIMAAAPRPRPAQVFQNSSHPYTPSGPKSGFSNTDAAIHGVGASLYATVAYTFYNFVWKEKSSRKVKTTATTPAKHLPTCPVRPDFGQDDYVWGY